MSCKKEIAEALRELGSRITPQRHAIIHILESTDHHLTPAQVYAEARKAVPGITEATVYRTLDFLADNGLLQTGLNDHRHLVYEIADEVHHHLICSSCRATIDINHNLFQDIFQKLEKQSGYKVTTRHLTFFGLCPKCRANSE